ncbi:MAG: fatty acid desaturase [Bacteroidota bacterium]|nr:fatty acid desaturase [Bacteroidota bacterium]
MLKYKADLRAVAYMIATSCLFAYQWIYGFNVWIYIIYLHFSVAVSVMTHNHNHINIWKNKVLNVFTDWWLTVFYGVPVFTWIPTHNRNHHRYNNKEGDSSITYRHTENNNIFSVLSYPSISGYHQMTQSIIPYMKQLWADDRPKFYEYLTQVFVLISWVATFLILDWQKALLYVVIPQQVSGFSVFVFNYVQHVHADEESRWNHSRNFMWVNAFLFNNGYHTMHHEKANIHWSELPQYHKEIEKNIAPDLIEKSFWGYIFKTYVLSIFVPKYRSESMRLKRIASGHNEPVTLH